MPIVIVQMEEKLPTVSHQRHLISPLWSVSPNNLRLVPDVILYPVWVAIFVPIRITKVTRVLDIGA
jgi:hypothetical protein